MKTDTWMPLYIDNYLGDTIRLTTEQHGAYLLLIMEGWKSGGRLPDDDDQLAAIAKMAPRDWRKIAPIIRRYFTVEGADLVQSRLGREVLKAKRLSEARRETGAMGGRPKKQKESYEEPIGFPEPPKPGGKKKQNETPAHFARPLPISDPNGSSNPPNPPRGDGRAEFLEALKVYPEDGQATGGEAAFWAAWLVALESVSASALLAAVRAYAAGVYAKRGSRSRRFDRWLRDGSYTAFIAPPGSAPIAWLGPPEVRAAVVAVEGEPWTRSYLDPCAWQDVPRRTLLTKSPTVAKAWRERAALLADLGIEFVLEKTEAA